MRPTDREARPALEPAIVERKALPPAWRRWRPNWPNRSAKPFRTPQRRTRRPPPDRILELEACVVARERERDAEKFRADDEAHERDLLRDEKEQAEARVARLTAALTRYGRHDDRCANHTGDAGGRFLPCGFDAAGSPMTAPVSADGTMDEVDALRLASRCLSRRTVSAPACTTSGHRNRILMAVAALAERPTRPALAARRIEVERHLQHIDDLQGQPSSQRTGRAADGGAGRDYVHDLEEVTLRIASTALRSTASR
jgi:hypothetical protein